jgi:hypothetical protein
MLMISSFSNLVNELLIPIAQKDTAIAMVIAIATIMIVEMTMLMPFLLRCKFHCTFIPSLSLFLKRWTFNIFYFQGFSWLQVSS